MSRTIRVVIISTFLLMPLTAWSGGNTSVTDPSNPSQSITRLWPDTFQPIPWELSQDGYPESGIDNQQIIDEFTAAFDTWEQVVTSTLDFEFNGQVNRRSVGFDGHNLVTFTDPDFVFAPGVVGVAVTTSFTQEMTITDENNDLDGDGVPDLPNGVYPPGTIFDGDIVFNSSLEYDVSGNNGSLDIRAIALHEAGHFFGLSHSSVSDAVMWPFLSSDVGQARTPSRDDLAYASHFYPQEPAFSDSYGYITGQVRNGNNNTRVLGAHVYALDPETGQKVVGGYTGNDGRYVLPITPGTYYIGIEPLDSEPRALDPKRINEVISFTFDTDFPEELYDANEAEIENDPFNAAPVSVTPGNTTDGIDLVTNTVELPGVSLVLQQGLDLFAYPAGVGDGITAFDLLSALGDESEVNAIDRFDPETSSFQRAHYLDGIPSGVDFPITRGEGYIVHSVIEHAVSFQGSSDCPNINLKAGFNLIGVPCPPPSFSAFDLLEALGNSHEVISVQRYVHETDSYETAHYGGIAPEGIDFPIVNGEAYVVEMRVDKRDVSVPGKNQLFPPALTGISPGQGVRGETVLLLGQGFDPDALANIVSFSRVGARVLHATPTVLTVEVPYTASSGDVKVSVNGRTSNALPFVVLPDVINENPDGEETELQSGQTAQGKISQDGEQDRYTFTALKGSSVTLNARAVTPGQPDLALVLEGPFGNALANDDNSGSGSDPLIASFKLPETGTYTAVVTSVPGTGIGAYEFSLQIRNANAVPQISVIDGNYQSTRAGNKLPKPIKLFISGPTGAGMAGVPVTVTATNMDVTSADAQLMNAGSFTIVSPGNGIVVIDVTTGNLPGLYYLDISAPGMAATQLRTSALGSEVRTVLVTNKDQSCTGGCPVNQFLPQPLGLQFLDASGDPVEGVIAQWKVISGGGLMSTVPGGGYESDDYSMSSDETGTMEAYFKLGKYLEDDENRPIRQLVVANISQLDPGVNTPVVFSADPKAGPPAKLSSNQSNFTRMTMNTSALGALYVRVTDEFDNPVAGAPISTSTTGSGLTVSPGLYRAKYFDSFMTNSEGIWVGMVSAYGKPTYNEFGDKSSPGLAPTYRVELSAGGQTAQYNVEVDMGPDMITASGQGVKGTVGQDFGTVAKRIIRFQRRDTYEDLNGDDHDDDGGVWVDEDFSSIRQVGVSGVPVNLEIGRSDQYSETDYGLQQSKLDNGLAATKTSDSGGYVTGQVVLGDVGGPIGVLGRIPSPITVEFFAEGDDEPFATQDFTDENSFAERTSILARPVIVTVELEDPFTGTEPDPDPYPLIPSASGIDMSRLKVVIDGAVETTVFDGPVGFLNYSLNQFPNYRRIWLDGVELSTIPLDLAEASNAGRVRMSYWPPASSLLEGTNTIRVEGLTDNAGNSAETDPEEQTFSFP